MEDFVINYYSVENNQVIGTMQQDTLVYAINGTNINYAKQQVFDKLVKSDDTQITLTIDVNGQKQDVIIKKEPIK